LAQQNLGCNKKCGEALPPNASRGYGPTLAYGFLKYRLPSVGTGGS